MNSLANPESQRTTSNLSKPLNPFVQTLGYHSNAIELRNKDCYYSVFLPVSIVLILFSNNFLILFLFTGRFSVTYTMSKRFSNSSKWSLFGRFSFSLPVQQITAAVPFFITLELSIIFWWPVRSDPWCGAIR